MTTARHPAETTSFSSQMDARRRGMDRSRPIVSDAMSEPNPRMPINVAVAKSAALSRTSDVRMETEKPRCGTTTAAAINGMKSARMGNRLRISL